MAKAKSSADSEGASVLKRMKITRAQKIMFAFVCGASVVFGVTLVLTIFLVRTIAFNAKVDGEKQLVIDALKKDQQNLTGLAASIDNISENQYLEAVARERKYENVDCSDYYNKSISFSDGEEISAEDLDRINTCSSLRVIAEAMPTVSTNVSSQDIAIATYGQLEKILDVANVRGNSKDDDGIMSVDESGTSDFTGTASTGVTVQPVGTLEASVNLEDGSTQIYSFMETIDRTIRNFDLQSATLELGDQMTFKGSYNTYYTNPVTLQVKKRTICADKKSDKCKAAGGDQSVKK